MYCVLSEEGERVFFLLFQFLSSFIKNEVRENTSFYLVRRVNYETLFRFMMIDYETLF